MAVRGPASLGDGGFFAEYPFLRGAEALATDLAASVRVLLEDPTLARARELGRARVRTALEDPRGELAIAELAHASTGEKFLSFQYARLLLGAAGSAAPTRRWAVSEAKRAWGRMTGAPVEELLTVAQRLDLGFTAEGEEVAIPWEEYVRLATPIREADFRLGRQRVAAGRVLVGRGRAARLLQEGIRRRLSEPLELTPGVREWMDANESEFLGEVRERIPAPQPRASLSGTPLRVTAFPPCIRHMRRALQDGENLSHSGRFALAAFLHRIGADAETIVDSYRGAPDFDEGITRYQVEHITQRNGGEGYDPPECETLRTHGLCTRAGEPTARDPIDRVRDPLCFEEWLRHPLQYYRIKSGGPGAPAPGRSAGPAGTP